MSALWEYFGVFLNMHYDRPTPTPTEEDQHE